MPIITLKQTQIYRTNITRFNGDILSDVGGHHSIAMNVRAAYSCSHEYMLLLHAANVSVFKKVKSL